MLMLVKNVIEKIIGKTIGENTTSKEEYPIFEWLKKINQVVFNAKVTLGYITQCVFLLTTITIFVRVWCATVTGDASIFEQIV